MTAPPPTTEAMPANPSGPPLGEAPVFVSAHPLRRLLVRAGIGVIAGLFAVWVIALASGVSGIGSLPGLQDKERAGTPEPAEATSAPAGSGASEQGTLDDGSAQPGAADSPSSQQGARTPDRTSAGNPGTQQAPAPAAPAEPTGPPDVTPGGNVPGANANGGNAYGDGQGGGGINTG